MDHFLGRNDEQMQCRGILHIVEAGDTLYKIGKKYGVPVSRVIYANPYVNVYNLQIGDEICVPVMTPRMPMGENDMPEQIMPMRQAPGMPARESNMQDPRMPARENNMQDPRMPARENNVQDPRMPARENPMTDSGMPPRGNLTMDSGISARENLTMDSGIPAHENPMEESGMPPRRDRMGFPLAPLEEAIVDVGHETENGAYMGNRMLSAEESRRTGMWEANPRPEEDQSMRNQPNMSKAQEQRTGISSGADQQEQEPVHADRKYMPEAEDCTQKENSCPERNTPKDLPWDDAGVSEQMIQEYLQEIPEHL